MNLLDMHTIISVTEEYLDDEQNHTLVTIKYMTWDSNGIASEQTESLKLTPAAQDEIVAGLKKLYTKLRRFD